MVDPETLIALDWSSRVCFIGGSEGQKEEWSQGRKDRGKENHREGGKEGGREEGRAILLVHSLVLSYIQ